MSIIQQRFLGASVIDFNCNLGWGESPSILTVDLVEDVNYGDAYENPPVGTPVLFDFNGWLFAGIIQSIDKKISADGNPIYSLKIEDPREILNGVNLILNGYTGTVSVPNLFNVYGYLESLGFGNAGVNEAGIKANKIRDTIIEFNNNTSTFGGLVKMLDFNYKLDLTNLPVMPDYYRIPNDNISVMDFVRTVCDDANHDFHFGLLINSGIYTIKLFVINKNFLPQSGAIASFVSSTQGAEIKNIGYEYANDVTSKFLVGGKINRMYAQTAVGGSDEDFETEPWDNTIWPYWGLYGNNVNSNVIIGEGLGNEHQFTVNIQHLDIPEFADFNYRYTVDVGELRAALSDMDTWLGYLQLRNNNKYRIDPDGEDKDFLDTYRPFKHIVRLKLTKNGETKWSFPTVEGSNHYHDMVEKAERNGWDVESFAITYKGSNDLNPHFGKADRLDQYHSILFHYIGVFLYHNISTSAIVDFLKPQTLQPIKNKKKDPNLDDFNPIVEEQISLARVKAKRERLYSFIRGIAEEFYGKQFMISLPIVNSTRDSETGVIYTDYTPKSNGFLSSSEYSSAVANNLVPIQYIDDDPDKGFLVDPRFINEEGKIIAYVRFNSLTGYDYSDIPSQDLIINESYNSVFIRCTVLDYFVYRDQNTLTSPRAVIQLPGRVLMKTNENNPFDFHVVASFLYPSLKEKFGEEEANTKLTEFLDLPGSDLYSLFQNQIAVWPSFAAIGLESNQRYGPWSVTGVNGKVVYEQDDTLVPWNFGSYTEMNNAAQSKVNQALSLYQVDEHGTVTFPGVPSNDIGSELITNGPIITNISVDVGSNGIKTTYNMAKWQVHPYKLSKHRNEAISRISKRNRDLERNFVTSKAKDVEVGKAELNFQKEFAYLKKEAGKGIHSSHEVFVSKDNYIVSQPTYNTINQSADVVGSYDQIIFPFHISGIPEISGDFSGIVNANTLNPFIEGATYQTVSSSGNYSIDDPSFDFSGIQAFGLRLPLMGVGYGFDLGGNCIPHSGQPLDDSGIPIDDSGAYLKTYHQDYLNPTTWTVAPFDFRLDTARHVWTMGNSILAKVVNIPDGIGPNIVQCERVIANTSGDNIIFTQISGQFDVINFRENYAVSGHKYLVHSLDGNYFLDVQHTFLDFE